VESNFSHLKTEINLQLHSLFEKIFILSIEYYYRNFGRSTIFLNEEKETKK